MQNMHRSDCPQPDEGCRKKKNHNNWLHNDVDEKKIPHQPVCGQHRRGEYIGHAYQLTDAQDRYQWTRRQPLLSEQCPNDRDR